MKILATIENVNIIELEDGSVTWTSHARIDDDGSDNRGHDKYWQPGTSLLHNGKPVDSEAVPGIVVPPLILMAVAGVVLGCKAEVTRKGVTTDAVVFDVGPHNKIGEMSPECARRLNISGDPNTGGDDDLDITYQIWPGVPACIDGETFELQPYRQS